MGVFDRIKRKLAVKNENSTAFRYAMAQKLNNRHVRYVTERLEGIEQIVGREGHLNILPDGERFAVTCGVEDIFRARIDSLTMGELMSLDGVVLTGFDEVKGCERSVTAFYLYYR